MEGEPSPLVYPNSSLENIHGCGDPGDPDQPDNRPSILITFQNSASYYTSYMGSGGMRGTANKRKTSDVTLPHQHIQEHPIVIMNDYPRPGPVSVALSDYKNYDRSSKAFSGPPTPPKPQGPPGPPGPPGPNVPSMRRESFNSNILELPKSRRGSTTPSLTSRNTTSSSRNRHAAPTHLPSSTPHARPGQFESSTLPRGGRSRQPRNSQSMPTLVDALNFDSLQQPTPSPRPSVCSSAVTDSQVERRPLMSEHRSSQDTEDGWPSPPRPVTKPNWLSLNIGDDDRKSCYTQSVYVAEIWPSIAFILTAVLITLIVYILVSYFYYVPHPSTRDSLASSSRRPTPYPPLPSPYPYPYPYLPPPYDRYPPYQLPPHHPTPLPPSP